MLELKKVQAWKNRYHKSYRQDGSMGLRLDRKKSKHSKSIRALRRFGLQLKQLEFGVVIQK